MGEMSICLLLYPAISEWVRNPYEVSGNLTVLLRPLKDHVVELARMQAMEDIDTAAQVEAQGDNTRATHIRQRATRLLYKLAPGRSGAIGAIKCGSGALAADSANMAKVLRQHWQDVFSARGVDEERLRAWIDEDLELRRDRGEMQEAMQHVRLQREQAEAAIRHSNNSSPGPDGIPYAAWRRLGDEAVGILVDAAVEMTEEDGFTLLGKVYSD